MRIKLSNGYTVSFNLEEGVSIKDAIKEAKKAVDTVKHTTKDFELNKEFDKNFGFRINELAKAIKEADVEKADMEVFYLMRDLKEDVKESHKNYTKMYKPEQLEAIINTYEKAIKVLKTDIAYEEVVEEAEELLKKVKENWNLAEEDKAEAEAPKEDSKKVKDKTAACDEENCWAVMLASKDGEELFLTHNNHFSPNIKMALLFSENDAKNKVLELGKKANPERFDFVCALCLETGEIAFVIELEKEVKEEKEEIDLELEDFEEVKDSKKVNDIPFRDPKENARLKSEYSVERLLEEARDAEFDEEAKKAALKEFALVKKELEDWIDEGRESLTKAGWDKSDARKVINERFKKGDGVRNGLIKALKNGGLVEESKELEALVKKLEKVLGLTSYRK